MTEEEFRTFFEPFGAISDAVVMIDRLTGRSRGFGFVTFEDESAVQAIFDSDPESTTNGSAKLVMRGKTCEVKRAVPRDGSAKHSANHRHGHEHKPRHDIRQGAPAGLPMVPFAAPVFDAVQGAGLAHGAQVPIPYHQGYAIGDENYYHPHGNYHTYVMPPYGQPIAGVYADVGTEPLATNVSPYAPPPQYPPHPYYGAVPNDPVSPVPQTPVGMAPLYPPATQFPPPPMP